MTTFIFLEVLPVHALFHDHHIEKDHCPVCEISLVFNHLPFIGSDSNTTIDQVKYYAKNINLFNHYSFIIDEKKDCASIVNRPPPNL